jgi:hypothetical protein
MVYQLHVRALPVSGSPEPVASAEKPMPTTE